MLEHTVQTKQVLLVFIYTVGPAGTNTPSEKDSWHLNLLVISNGHAPLYTATVYFKGSRN